MDQNTVIPGSEPVDTSVETAELSSFSVEVVLDVDAVVFVAWLMLSDTEEPGVADADAELCASVVFFWTRGFTVMFVSRLGTA